MAYNHLPCLSCEAAEGGGWWRIGGLDARQPRVPVPTSPIWQAAAPWRPACAREPRGFVPTSPFWQAEAPVETGLRPSTTWVCTNLPYLAGPSPRMWGLAQNRGVGRPSTACACANLPYLAGRGPAETACARQPREPVPTSPIWQAEAPVETGLRPSTTWVCTNLPFLAGPSPRMWGLAQNRGVGRPSTT